MDVSINKVDNGWVMHVYFNNPAVGALVSDVAAVATDVAPILRKNMSKVFTSLDELIADLKALDN